MPPVIDLALTLSPPDLQEAYSSITLPLPLLHTPIMNSGLDFLQRPSSNQPPPDDEIPRIRSFRQDCQARIDSVNQQIDQLLQQRKLLETDLERYDSLLAPVKRVPETSFQQSSNMHPTRQPISKTFGHFIGKKALQQSYPVKFAKIGGDWPS